MKQQFRITADTALRLAHYFGNSPKCWLGLQDDYDLEEAQRGPGGHLRPHRATGAGSVAADVKNTTPAAGAVARLSSIPGPPHLPGG